MTIIYHYIITLVQCVGYHKTIVMLAKQAQADQVIMMFVP